MQKGLWLVGAMLALARPVEAGRAEIAADRMLTVDGQRVFVLGLYENPKDDAVLAEAVGAGINLVHSAADAEALGRLHKAGVGAWLNTGGLIDLSEDPEGRQASLAEMVASYGSHPALLVWEVPDEALWNCWYSATQWRCGQERTQLRERFETLEDKTLASELEAQLQRSERLFEAADFAGSEELADEIWKKLGENPPNPGLNLSNAAERAAKLCGGMVAGYNAMKGLDPNHPVWMNHAPRNQIAQLGAFNEGADIVGCDIYPAPAYRTGHSDLGDRSLASVGGYTTRMQAAAPGKPVWMVLQGFGWADLKDSPDERSREDGRRPTFEESRFMAYDAIVRGARGVLYWGTYRIEKDATLWRDLLKLVRELADLERVLSAPDATLVPRVEVAETWGSLDRSVRVLGKDVDGVIWWLVVNEWHEPLRCTLHRLSELEGVAYEDTTTGSRAVVAEGSLQLPMPGYGVQVLKPVD